MQKKWYTAFLAVLCVGCLCMVKAAKGSLSAMQADSDSGTYDVIILDAGHGGYDGGTVACDGTLEKDINLSIVRKLDALFRAAGVQTVLTRANDNSIHDPQITSIRKQKISDIHNRLKIMEQTDNSLFISIHQNHFGQSKYKGTQAFYSGNDPQSKRLAQSVQDAVVQSIQPDNHRTIKKSGTEIYLLYHAVRPAVMVECGFLSNPEETALLHTDDYQKKIAMAIYKGVLQFLDSTEVI